MDNGKYLEKINSDILDLMDLIEIINREINTISFQLENRKDNKVGNFNNWKCKAGSALNHKKSELKSVKLQLSFWDKEKEIVVKKINKAHNELMREHSLLRESEKTKRHEASMIKENEVNRLFRKLIKEFIGLDDYVRIIEESREIVENNLELNKG